MRRPSRRPLRRPSRRPLRRPSRRPSRRSRLLRRRCTQRRHACARQRPAAGQPSCQVLSRSRPTEPLTTRGGRAAAGRRGGGLRRVGHRAPASRRQRLDLRHPAAPGGDRRWSFMGQARGRGPLKRAAPTRKPAPGPGSGEVARPSGRQGCTRTGQAPSSTRSTPVRQSGPGKWPLSSAHRSGRHPSAAMTRSHLPKDQTRGRLLAAMSRSLPECVGCSGMAHPPGPGC